MYELKTGDVFRVTRPFTMTFYKADEIDIEWKFDTGQLFTVAEVRGDFIYAEAHFHTDLHSAVITYGFNVTLVDDGSLEILRPIEEPEEPETHTEPEVPKEEKMKFGYSFFAVKNGQRRPSGMLYQAAANKLSELLGVEEMHAGTVDGIMGNAFMKSSTAIQKHFFPDSTPDNVIGRGTWAAMTEALGDWRPPLRWRLAEQQNTFENGIRSNCFGAWNIVSTEGWPNYGLWNFNYPAKWGGSIGGSSLGAFLKIADRTDLYQYEPSQPQIIADFVGSKEGREIQIGPYMDRYIIQPAINNLKTAGFDFPVDNAADLPDEMNPFLERLLAIACDICVNSGPAGMFPHRIPRIWDGSGVLAWDDALPNRDACMKVYAEEYEVAIPSPIQDFSHKSDSRETHKRALKRCVQEVCETNEQRINLIADMQGRCVTPSKLGDSTLQKMVLRRRRCVARLGGYNFQGSDYDTQVNFGIGVPK